MDSLRRENRVLRVAILVLFCALAADVGTSGNQSQRLPGPGSGIVDVAVVNEPGITQRGEWKVAQQGEWRVAQQGDWRVGGTVVAIPAMPDLVTANRSYDIYWNHENAANRVTVREVHTSGWARVVYAGGQERWVNLSRAVSIAGPF